MRLLASSAPKTQALRLVLLHERARDGPQRRAKPDRRENCRCAPERSARRATDVGGTSCAQSERSLRGARPTASADRSGRPPAVLALLALATRAPGSAGPSPEGRPIR